MAGGHDQHHDSPVDLRYGPLTAISPQDRFVRFSFVTHRLLLLATVMLALGGAAILFVALHVVLPPRTLTVARAIPMRMMPPRSTRRATRPGPAPLAERLGPMANIVEKTSTGLPGRFTYREVDVPLEGNEPDQNVPSGKMFFYQQKIADTPRFPIRPVSAHVPPPAGPALPVRGVPINVSTVAESPPLRIERVAIMPRTIADVRTMLVAAGVETSELAGVAAALKTETIRAPDRLDLLLRRSALRDVGTRILAMRQEWADRSVEVWAPGDHGAFVRLAGDTLFERLSRKADVSGFTPVGRGIATSDVTDNRSMLGVAIANAGIPAKLAAQVASLVRNETLDSDSKPATDERSLIVLFRTNASGDSRIVSVTLRGAEGDATFYRFQSSPDMRAEFFDAEGRSVSEMLLHKPVPNGRLGDGFAWRLHPILKRWLHHNGVDYDAPYGSPIVAAGDGKVVIIGHEWGYGNYVRIRHDEGYFTTYAHISRAVPTLKVGQRVEQGQVIAYIGSTGLSTGPHLYYELKVDGRYRDPLKAHLPAGTWLTGDRLARLHKQIEQVGRIEAYIRSLVTDDSTSQSRPVETDHQIVAEALPGRG